MAVDKKKIKNQIDIIMEKSATFMHAERRAGIRIIESPKH